MTKCIYCNCTKLYELTNNHLKCSSCKRKFSLEKIKIQKEILKYFCLDFTALEASKELKKSYNTIQNKYKTYRSYIIDYIETNYEDIKSTNYEFDEYIYSKDKNLKNAHNFLTFNYSNYIYNIALPSLNSKFTMLKTNKDLEKFLKYNKIAKLESFNSYINEFWVFFESFLKKYKGVTAKNFNIYLKEAEFKFNYSSLEQEKILENYLINS